MHAHGLLRECLLRCAMTTRKRFATTNGLCLPTAPRSSTEAVIRVSTGKSSVAQDRAFLGFASMYAATNPKARTVTTTTERSTAPSLRMADVPAVTVMCGATTINVASSRFRDLVTVNPQASWCCKEDEELCDYYDNRTRLSTRYCAPKTAKGGCPKIVESE